MGDKLAWPAQRDAKKLGPHSKNSTGVEDAQGC
jgi:hypothetical protein